MSLNITGLYVGAFLNWNIIVNWVTYHLAIGSISKLSQKCSLYNTLNSFLRTTKAINYIYKAKILDSGALQQMVAEFDKVL